MLIVPKTPQYSVELFLRGCETKTWLFSCTDSNARCGVLNVAVFSEDGISDKCAIFITGVYKPSVETGVSISPCEKELNVWALPPVSEIL